MNKQETKIRNWGRRRDIHPSINEGVWRTELVRDLKKLDKDELINIIFLLDENWYSSLTRDWRVSINEAYMNTIELPYLTVKYNYQKDE